MLFKPIVLITASEYSSILKALKGYFVAGIVAGNI
jgi:hypothetical protein